MLNLVVIMTANEPFLTFKEAQSKLEEEYPGMYHLDLFNTTELDDDEEIYAACAEGDGKS